MENETDVTRAQMDATRASMSEKMETLEHQVVDSVQGAADAVTQTVDNVKDISDAVHETVENVKDAFDLRLQMTRHPWVIVGGSIALGCLGGYFLFRRGAAQPSASQPASSNSPGVTEKQNGAIKSPPLQDEASRTNSVRDAAPVASDSGWRGGLHQWFGAEIDKAKGLAIGMVLGVVRDVITQSTSQLFKAGLVDVIDGITVKLGGEPLHAPVFKDGAAGANENGLSTRERPRTADQRQCPSNGIADS